jgi:hypothetical protein
MIWPESQSDSESLSQRGSDWAEEWEPQEIIEEKQ